jgi:FkbH-like protein
VSVETLAISSSLSRSLRGNRDALSLALVKSIAAWDKYSSELSEQSAWEGFARRETAAFVDYIATFFATGDPTFRNLYIGEKLKQCYDERDTPEEAIERRRSILALDRDTMLGVIGPTLDEASYVRFVEELNYIQDVLTRPLDKNCHILLIGDCLFLDLLGFLTVPLMQAGIRLVPTFVTSKLISGQHRELRENQAKEFDLVFYSPLTYAFHIDFSEFQFVRSSLIRPSYRKTVIESAKEDIKATLHLIKTLFECPVFVHNSANLRRHNGTWLDSAKTLVTQPVRAHARRVINSWLSGHVDGLSTETHNVFLLDETSQFKTTSEYVLSKMLYGCSALQHPAYFGKALAPVYVEIIIARMILSKKKLIICDLDNTLWKGIIGEGAIDHMHQRQSVLLALRKKGFLLSICSKNDPKNVHWRGGTLSEDDFVCQQINWDSKSKSIRRIAQILNLKSKDFIFIDDRADERALVAESMPEITVLDAESPDTWSQLSVLAALLNENTEGDRTLAYKQREERERFLTDTSDGDVKIDEAEALAKLNLQLVIRPAGRGELARVSELINRTNQFNTCGSRTSLREVTRWFESDRHAIWIAEASDKFGGMGTISVAVIEETGRGVEILTFVLSCRVFGYGIENAILNRVKKWRSGSPVYGHFKETPFNGPCHRTYPDNGFSKEGPDWVFQDGPFASDVGWLTIRDETLPIRSDNITVWPRHVSPAAAE